MDRETKKISKPEKHDPTFRENELHKGLPEMAERVARQNLEKKCHSGGESEENSDKEKRKSNEG